jgi:hypothetical protein
VPFQARGSAVFEAPGPARPQWISIPSPIQGQAVVLGAQVVSNSKLLFHSIRFDRKLLLQARGSTLFEAPGPARSTATFHPKSFSIPSCCFGRPSCEQVQAAVSFHPTSHKIASPGQRLYSFLKHQALHETHRLSIPSHIQVQPPVYGAQVVSKFKLMFCAIRTDIILLLQAGGSALF